MAGNDRRGTDERRGPRPFGFRDVALAEKQGLVDGVFDRVAGALRPHERPDVRRAAPVLEGCARGLARAAAAGRAQLSACSTSRAAPATSPSASPTARRKARVTVADINARDAGRRHSERAARRQARQARLRRGQCRGSALRRRPFRCRNDRLRHPQRAADRSGARRGLPRAQAGRPLPLPRILRRRTSPGSTGSTSSSPSTSFRRSAGSWPAMPSPTNIWSNRSAAFPTRRASPR